MCEFTVYLLGDNQRIVRCMAKDIPSPGERKEKCS